MHVQPIVFDPFKFLGELKKTRFTTNPNLIYTLFYLFD
jgi:hypothetical protein